MLELPGLNISKSLTRKHLFRSIEVLTVIMEFSVFHLLFPKSANDSCITLSLAMPNC